MLCNGQAAAAAASLGDMPTLAVTLLGGGVAGASTAEQLVGLLNADASASPLVAHPVCPLLSVSLLHASYLSIILHAYPPPCRSPRCSATRPSRAPPRAYRSA